MKKMGIGGVKWVKIVHLFVMVLMLGGIISSTTIRISLPLADFDPVFTTYRALQIIGDYVVRYGAQGLILTGIVYGVWTNWGWFKHRWITVKWIIFMVQTIFGIVFVDRWMEQNLSLLEAQRGLALTNPIFLRNHWLIQVGGTAQTLVILFLIWVSVFKPWKQKAERQAAPGV